MGGMATIVRLAAAGLMLVVVSWGGASTVAESDGGPPAARGICPNTLCVFADEDFQGQQVDVTKEGLSNKLARKMDDQASSLVNDRSGAAFIYAKEDGKGRTICLASGDSLNYLSGLQMDGRASSTRLVARRSCFSHR